jgi:uncharacterized protein YbjT (DUF2867 family)
MRDQDERILFRDRSSRRRLRLAQAYTGARGLTKENERHTTARMGPDMMDGEINSARLVTVFGGSGFIGRHVVRELARRGWRIRVATRRPDLAFHLQPLGRVGQIQMVQANVRFPDSVAHALRGSDAVVNLVGILSETGRQRFDAVHEFGARVIARAASEAGVRSLVHMSALSADPASASTYAASKGKAEAAVLENFPQAVILRPSVVFGPEDEFFNRFATMARYSWALPAIGGGANKMQPVFVGDVAQALAQALDGKATAGAGYELGGPEVKSFRELLQSVCDITGRKRFLAPLPFGAARAVAWATEWASKLSLGLFPAVFTFSRDQVELLKSDNIVSAEASAQGRTLQGLGVEPQSAEAIVPTYLYRFRKTGQFDAQRLA